MQTTPVDHQKYFLPDEQHYFIVRNDEYDSSFKRVLFYCGATYIANERLHGRSVETLKAEYESRKIPIPQ
ncbi:MAG: hypothetical protein JNL72_06160 [Flavipsychrobacter sp.]|nr:hypothetical protein [Flavipsychrobacter sp.]